MHSSALRCIELITAVSSPGSLSSSSGCTSMGVTVVADTDGVPLAAGDSAIAQYKSVKSKH